MPKIIKNIREHLIAVAAAQVKERGYSGTTIRSVAAECGVGIGTVYNYFDTKDTLIATMMVEEWYECLSAVGACASPRDVLSSIYEAILRFSEKNAAIFSDPEAMRVFSAVHGERHKQLRDQLSAYVRPFCRGESDSERDLLAAFITEAVISHALEGVPFDALYKIISKII